ncbi:MAG: BamA/TamA family outer membrane protein [Steroidobacteraceae bacterium]
MAEVEDSQEQKSLSFRVDVVSENRAMARHLERYLDIQRFTSFPDLQPSELRRLLGEVERNARDLLAAQGYFEPQLKMQVGDAPAGDERRRIAIDVDTGQRAKVGGFDIGFAEPMNSAGEGERQRRAIIRDWTLKTGDAFAQVDWDAAKSSGLRTLQRNRYPAARIAGSRATVDAAAGRVDLQVEYDAGPLYRFGELQMTGLARYDAEGVRNIARIPAGADYSEDALLDAQQRLVASGYFDGAFLMLDTSGDPQRAQVQAQLREARYQKIVFGLGFSTDAGGTVSIDHTHNKMWPLGWRAVNAVEIGTETQSLSTQMTDMPAASGWAWYTGAALERSDYGDFKARSVSLTGGRTRSLDRTERRYYVQYDGSEAEGGDAPGASSSLLGNFEWTGRYFDNRTNPTRGRGYGLEAGAGLTVTPDRDPFLRVKLRALQLLPIGGRNVAGKRSRLAIRGELGGVGAADGTRIPVTLLYLTGGDTTVRGYSYQSIGTRLDDGQIYGARYMAMGSVEWQRPVRLFGDAASFEHTVFVDSGTATDKPRDAVLYTGVGTGMRYSSPVGPLQLDVAYGLKSEKWRLHLRMGFQF